VIHGHWHLGRKKGEARIRYDRKRQSQEVEVVFAEVSGGKNLASSRIFELHYRVRNICQLPRMRKQNVTIAGPSHKMRPSSPARLYEPTMPLPPLRSVRSAKNYNSPASSSAVRPSTKKRHNWNDREIVANCKDTPIRRCGGNQRGNWRNERRPCVAMTGPTRAGDKSTTPRYGVTLLRWEPDSLASMDLDGSLYPLARGCRRIWRGEIWFRRRDAARPARAKVAGLGLLISGPRITLNSHPYAPEGADGQAVVCPLLRGRSPTRGVAPKPHRGLRRAFSPAFRAGGMVLFIPWRVGAEESGAAKYGFGGAMLLDRRGPRSPVWVY